MWLDLKGEWSRALGTKVRSSVSRLRLLLAVATPAHVALIFPVAIFLVSEVATIGTLLVVKDPLVVLHEAAQLLGQLQGQVLLGSRLRAVHHHSLRRLVQGGHQLLVNDHLADDGVYRWQVQLKHVGQRLHAGEKEGPEQGVMRTRDHNPGLPRLTRAHPT